MRSVFGGVSMVGEDPACYVEVRQGWAGVSDTLHDGCSGPQERVTVFYTAESVGEKVGLYVGMGESVEDRVQTSAGLKLESTGLCFFPVSFLM